MKYAEKHSDDKDEILKEIRSAEEEAERIVSQARRKAEQIINDSRKFSAKLINDKKEELQQNSQKEIKEKNSAFEAEKKKIIKKAGDDADKLEDSSKKVMNKGVELVIKKFEDYIAE